MHIVNKTAIFSLQDTKNQGLIKTSHCLFHCKSIGCNFYHVLRTATYKNLKQVPSNNGKNFPELHIHIMNIKSWLRGIHHHISEKRLQGYLDEYHYRFNRRNRMEAIFDMLIRRMVKYEPARLKIAENVGGLNA